MAHAANTIWLKGEGVVKEGKANAAITPGHLIHRLSTGNFAVHATAAATVVPTMFAMEQDFVGKDITAAYAANDRVQAVIPAHGAEIYALVPANAAALVIGDYVESNGDGTLRKATPFSQSGITPFAVVAAGFVVGRVLEAIDNSANAAVARVRIEIR